MERCNGSSELSGVEYVIDSAEASLGLRGDGSMSQNALKGSLWKIIGFGDFTTVTGFPCEFHDWLKEVGKQP